MLRLGLTGGIASGKSTVSGMLRKLGFTVLDADSIGHEVIEPGQPAYDEVVREFGASILDAKNRDAQKSVDRSARARVDRSALARIVFADPAKLARLNAIVHPRLEERLNLEFAKLARVGSERDGSERDGSERDGSERDGSERDGSAHDGSARDGSARDGSARDGSAHDGSARDGSARDGSARDGSAHDGSARDGSARDGSARDGSARDGSARDGSAAAAFVEAAFVEAALIIEAGLDKKLDGVVVVWCEPRQQMERLVVRGFSEEEARRRIAAQLPVEEKLRRATEKIDCSGSIAETQRQVEQLATKLRAVRPRV